jgi:hypothetical protein
MSKGLLRVVMTPEHTALLEMYKENATQARQHETQRERMSAAVVAIGVALTAFIAQNMKDHPTIHLLLPALFMVVLGLFGALVSRKHFERNRLHTEIMAAYRNALEATLTNTPLESIRLGAKTKHEGWFPWLSQRRLYVFWDWLNGFIALVGIVLSIVILLRVELGAGDVMHTILQFSDFAIIGLMMLIAVAVIAGMIGILVKALVTNVKSLEIKVDRLLKNAGHTDEKSVIEGDKGPGDESIPLMPNNPD